MCVPAYTLAGSVIDLGMSAWQGIVCILLVSATSSTDSHSTHHPTHILLIVEFTFYPSPNSHFLYEYKYKYSSSNSCFTRR